VVTVDGSVSTPSGAFESSFFDKGFGLQDRSAGIYVSLQTDLGVAPRRQARVTGTLQNSFGLLILVPADPSDVKLHGAGPKVQAQWVTTGAVGEATEGRIVRVVGTITQAPTSDLPFGYKFFVDDGSGELQIFVNTQTGIDLSGLSLGQTVSVTGFSSQFDTHYEIDPRSPADITVPAL
jgi:DNA/RNA endonuclease YhcR with UshA esterase domain